MRVTSKLANEKARDIDSDGIVLSEEKKQQIIALGKLGWPLLRIEQATGVRRGTGAFAAALSDATENPPPMTPETRQIAARIKAAEKSVMADQDRVSKLTQQVAKARGGAKDTTQEQCDARLRQARLFRSALDDRSPDRNRHDHPRALHYAGQRAPRSPRAALLRRRRVLK
jgi:hypothetical protein